MQRVSGDGVTLGGNAAITEASGLAGAPGVAYSATDDRFLVGWTARDSFDGYDVWGQWLDSSGDEVLDDDFRLSDLGGVADDAFNGGFPVIAWNGARNAFLVAWWGDDDIAGGTEGGGVDDDAEIYGQLVSSDVIFSDYFERGDTSAW